MVPKIIHQTWKTDEIPPEWQPMVNSWKWQHATWEYKLWTNKDGFEFVKNNYPELYETYCAYPYDIQRADMIRYIVVYHFGGVYADMDYECLQPLDDLMDDSQFIIGVEPTIHAEIFDKKELLCNALFASVPKSPFLKQVLDNLKNDETIALTQKDILATTGPLKLQEVFESYTSNDLTVYPAEVLCPVPNLTEELQHLSQNTSKSRELKLALINQGSYAIHYWSNSWVRNLAGDLINPNPNIIEGFTFHQGMDSFGNDISNGGRDVVLLAKQCLAQNDVDGFNTDGFVKNKLLPREEWYKMYKANANEGLYVKNKI